MKHHDFAIARRAAIAFLVALAALTGGALPAAATTTYTVTTTADSGKGSLRDALDEAPASAAPVTIDFDHKLTGKTINVVEPLYVRSSVIINGSDAPGVQIASRSAAVPSLLLGGVNKPDVTMSSLAVSSVAGGTAITNLDADGTQLSLGSVKLTNVTVAAGSTTIAVSPTTVAESHFRSGATLAVNQPGGAVDISGSTFTGARKTPAVSVTGNAESVTMQRLRMDDTDNAISVTGSGSTTSLTLSGIDIASTATGDRGIAVASIGSLTATDMELRGYREAITVGNVSNHVTMATVTISSDSTADTWSAVSLSGTLGSGMAISDMTIDNYLRGVEADFAQPGEHFTVATSSMSNIGEVAFDVLGGLASFTATGIDVNDAGRLGYVELDDSGSATVRDSVFSNVFSPTAAVDSLSVHNGNLTLDNTTFYQSAVAQPSAHFVRFGRESSSKQSIVTISKSTFEGAGTLNALGLSATDRVTIEESTLDSAHHKDNDAEHADVVMSNGRLAVSDSTFAISQPLAQLALGNTSLLRLHDVTFSNSPTASARSTATPPPVTESKPVAPGAATPTPTTATFDNIDSLSAVVYDAVLWGTLLLALMGAGGLLFVSLRRNTDDTAR